MLVTPTCRGSSGLEELSLWAPGVVGPASNPGAHVASREAGLCMEWDFVHRVRPWTWRRGSSEAGGCPHPGLANTDLCCKGG